MNVKKNLKNLMILTAVFVLFLFSLTSPVWTERDLSLLEYDIDYQVGILGVEEYQNMDLKNNPNVETVKAAKDELLVCLADDQELEVIFDIAEKYHMEILQRVIPDAPLFHLRFIQHRRHKSLEKVWAALLKDERVKYVEPNFIMELIE